MPVNFPYIADISVFHKLRISEQRKCFSGRVAALRPWYTSRVKTTTFRHVLLGFGPLCNLMNSAIQEIEDGNHPASRPTPQNYR